MTYSIPNRVLVTGAPRSGTTIVGRLLASSSDVVYLWEPFNPQYRAGLPRNPLYVGPDTPELDRSRVDRVVEGTVAVTDLRAAIREVPSDGSLKRLGKKVGINRTSLRYLRARLSARLRKPTTLLVKDPMAAFLAPRLIEAFDFRVVVVVRHPAAHAVARQERGWGSGEWLLFRNLWESPQLFHDLLEPYADTCGLTAAPESAVARAAFVWLAFNGPLIALARNFPDRVHVVRHEDFCLSPSDVIASTAQAAGIVPTRGMLKSCERWTSGRSMSQDSHDLARVERRDARALPDKWRSQLTDEFLSQLRAAVSETGRILYPRRTDWVPSGSFS